MGMRRIWIVVVVALLASACGSSDDGTTAPTTTPTTTAEAGASASSPPSTTTPAATSTSSIAPPVTPSIPPPVGVTDLERRQDIPYRPAGNKLIVYGDSMAMSMQEHFLNFTAAGGRLDVNWRAVSGAALCDYVPGLAAELERETPWAVLLFFTNNAFTSCMQDDAGEPLTGDPAIAKFQFDLAEALTITGAAGITTYLVTVPTTRTEVGQDNPTSARINTLVWDSADRLDHVEVIDAAPSVLAPDGSYTETLPCLPVEPCTGGVDDDGVPVNLVRDPFGGHFCTGGFGPPDDRTYDELDGLCPVWASGAFRFGAAVASPLVEAAYADQLARQ